jgi:signal transduction histidine kinase/CheY-like chemotaxis protein
MIDNSEIVEALTADYMNVFVAEPESNLGEIVKLNGWAMESLKQGPRTFNYTQAITEYAEQRVSEDDGETFLELVLPESIIAKFSDGRNRFEISFRIVDDGKIRHYSLSFIRVSKPDESLRVIAAFRDVDSVVSARKKQRDLAINSAYAAMSQMFMAMMRVDVKCDSYYSIKSTEAIDSFVGADGGGSFSEDSRRVIKALATSGSYESAKDFLDITTLEERMRGKTSISTSFVGKVAGLCRLNFVKESVEDDGGLEYAIFTMELSEEDKFHSAFDALARNFQNVFWVNTKDDTARIMKLDGYVTRGLDKEDRKFFPYPATLRRYVDDRVHPDDREMVYDAICTAHLREVFATQDEYMGNYRVLIDGEVHNYQWNICKMQGIDYLVMGFQNIDDIVNETLAAERKQKEKEAEYQRRLEEQLTIFDTLARNYRNVYLANMNDGTAKVLKLSTEYSDKDLSAELANKTFPYDAIIAQWSAEYVHPDDRERMVRALSTENARAMLADADEYTGTYRGSAGGDAHNWQFSVYKLSDEGDVIVGFQIIDDIIEEHLAEEREQREREEAYQRELIAAKDEADRANSAKTDFLLRMSHDVRTPLNGIMGMLEIADRFPDDLEKQAECRTKIEDSSKILLELINEVLDMSKLESGEIVLERVPFSLVDISLEVSGVIAKQAEERSIEIVQENCKAPDHMLVGSPTHFKRLMMNILSNAIKYNVDHGKVYVTCRELSCENGVSTVQFKCRDTGIGMSPEFQKRIFEPFAQEERSPRSKYSGTGLGMPIAKSIVEKMGGTITFESEQGVGTTFDVRIPFGVEEAADSASTEEVAAEDSSITGMRILLVEDNDLNMEIAKFLLEEEGAVVAQAWNGEEAVKTFEQSEPGAIDAVLMDVMMPVLDGYGAARAIRALDRPDAATVPIIAMTANAFAEDRIAAKEAGMDDHIAKPIDIKNVVQTLLGLVGR